LLHSNPDEELVESPGLFDVFDQNAIVESKSNYIIMDEEIIYI